MTCIRPAGRRGACSCGNQYAQILDRLDTVEQEASDAKTTAQTAANSASIQAANAAADAAQAALDAADALLQAGNAAASAAAAAQDAGNAAADLASINSTISSTLTTYLGTKVDKLTTTGSFAYTHTNATQGETALVDGTTSNTIPIRDGNGRMQAADPASGATDKTLVTANWASQAGSGAPNNLLHTNGNETKTGDLTMSNGVLSTNAIPVKNISNRIGSSSVWAKLYSWTASNVQRGISFQVFSRNDGRTAYYTAMGNTSNGTIHNDGSWTGIDNGFRLAYDGVSTISLFFSGQRKSFTITDSGISNNTGTLAITIEDASVDAGEPVVGPDYSWVVSVT